MGQQDQLIRIFSREIREILLRTKVDFQNVQEIRLRVQAPLLMIVNGQEYFVTVGGMLGREASGWERPSQELSHKEAYIVSREQIKETMEYISSHSLYAFEEELRQGFLTIPGGHRIGIAGKTVLDDRGIRTIKNISFLNVRLAHQVRGCADQVMPYLYEDSHENRYEKHGDVFHTLIISPPRCGKTTLLRDIIRQLSDGTLKHQGVNVGVVDERSEIGACYQGIPQNELGIRTDVLDCCPKARGMMMMIRTMSPQVVAVDEIGSQEDLQAMEYVMNCGCKLLATVHGKSLEDIRQKPVLGKMVEEKVFERYILLDHEGKIGHIRGILDRDGKRIL